MTMTFSADEKFALQLDAEDPLRQFREKFHLPLSKYGKPLIYFAGNSLGLMPKAARKIVDQELDDWAKLAVDAHLKAETPWYSYHETLREPMAQLVGAQPNEVICMNSLTVNLHLMMATFYRPTKSRFKILISLPIPMRSKHRSCIMGSTRKTRLCSRDRARESSRSAKMTSRLRWRSTASRSRWFLS